MQLIGALGLLFWTLWCIRKLFALGYKPETRSFWTTASVVVPVFDEKGSVVHQCIRSIEENHPTEIIVVFNGGKLGYKERLKDKHPNVRSLYLNKADKRYAMALGAKMAKGEIVVFVDSDVRWEKNTLTELLKPFVDPKVGGVSTNQIIDNADVSIWTTLGSWLTEMGLTTGTPFQSVKKCVSCLRGRTAAYRREMVLSFLDDFQDEVFLGRRCRAGDDGRLTFLTLRSGHGTFYQSTAIVHTTLPTTLQELLKNRLRCNRNTFRRYFSSITQRWFWRQNWRFLVELLASVVIPLGFINCIANFLTAAWHQEWLYVILMFGWFCVGRSLRGAGWIREKPSRILKMPLMVISFLFLLSTVRWYALFTMNEQGWLTRGVKKPEIRKHPLAAGTAVAMTMITVLACHSGINLMSKPPISQAIVISPTSSTIIAVGEEGVKQTPAVSPVVSTVGLNPNPTSTQVTPIVSISTIEPRPTLTSTPRPQQSLIGRELLVGIYLPEFPPERNLDAFETEMGQMDIIAWFQNWDQGPITRKLEISCSGGQIPLITWESWTGRKSGARPYRLDEVATGSYDQLIAEQLRAIGQTCIGRTVLIRFSHEMNTRPGKVSWYPWQGDPEAYVSAWRRVVTIGREVAPNIKWVWSPIRANDLALLYWPGEEYVDYVGLTLLNFWPHREWKSFAEMYEPQREVLLSTGKPVVIAEVAIGEGPNPEDKAVWITEMFQNLQSEYEEVVVVAWFNHLHAREFEEVVWRLDSGPEAKEAFQTSITALRGSTTE